MVHLTHMNIMGIDPGTARVGWSVVRADGPRIQPISFGCIETDKDTKREVRLLEIFTALSGLIRTHHPDAMAVEDLFFSTNAKTVISVGEARGVVLLAAAQHTVPVISYSPLTVKRAITGDGAADKKQVSRMVFLTLGLTRTPALDDTTDALAIAMTHAYSYKIKQLV